MENLPIEIQELIHEKAHRLLFADCLKDLNNTYQTRLERLKGKGTGYERNIFVKAYYMNNGKYHIICYPITKESNLNHLNESFNFCERVVIVGIEPMSPSSFIERFNYYQDKYLDDPNLIHFKL